MKPLGTLVVGLGMDPHQGLDEASADVLAALEQASAASRVVVVDVDRAVLAKPAMQELLGLLFRSGSIGPIRWIRERRISRRAAAGRTTPSGRYVVDIGHDDFVRLVSELAADLVASACPAMLEAVSRHVEAGDFVVIATDAPRELATAMAQEFGAHRGCGTSLERTGELSFGGTGFSGRVLSSAAALARNTALVEELGQDALTTAVFYRNRLA